MTQRPLIINFLSHVQRDGEHLLWQGATDGQGYGRFRVGGRVLAAHRASFIFKHGAVPDGHVVVATCGHRICVMPSHLKAITRKEFAARPRPGAKKSYKRYGPADLFLNPKKYRNHPRWKHLLLDDSRIEKWRREGKRPKCRCHGRYLAAG